MKRALLLLPIAAIALALTAAGCAGSTEASADDDAPAVELSVRPACIDPCGIHYEVRLPATVTNQTYRPTTEITTLVLDAVRTRLATRSDIDVDEGADPTTRSDAYSLTISVPPLVYAAGRLTGTVRINIFRYRSGALLGTIERRATTAATPYNQPAEDLVLRTAATNATQAFIDALPSL